MGCSTMANNEEYNDYLAHHGVKGMKWGRRKQRRTENKAAKAHFKTERTMFGSKKFQKASKKKSLEEAKLSSKQVKEGRYRVARARNIKRNAASISLGTLSAATAAKTGIGLICLTGGAATPAVLAAVGTVGLGTALAARKITGASYYGKQKKAYKRGIKNEK